MSEHVPSQTDGLRGFLFTHGPRYMGIVTFCVGALVLVSASIPGNRLQENSIWQQVLDEMPIMGLTLGALALMALSLGLMRRLRFAWLLTLGAALQGALISGAVRPRAFELVIYSALSLLLIVSRKHFYRRSSLSHIVLDRTWFLAVLLAVVLASFFSLLWVSHQQGFIEARFMDLLIDPVLGVAGRPIALALALLGIAAFYFAVASPARLQPELASDHDFTHLSALLHQADMARPDNLLAFVGDKSVFYGPEKSAALAYAEISGVRIAMGPPIGPQSAWKPTLEAFLKAAQVDGVRPAIYSATPELLPNLLELRFQIEKIGENAILNLPDFSLSGRKREGIRRSQRKLAERSGASFEITLPPHSDRLLADLLPVSQAWLAVNGGQEKSFSLGRFDPAFLTYCPLGIVKLNGRIAAFGSLLTTPDKVWAGVDLMRYDPGFAITNTMDFLLVELILWAKRDGYQKFDLAMVPLSGLVQAELAPLYARIGNFVYEHGERFYNFRGLRRFKQKFDPAWEPRYIAAPGYWSLPWVLARAGWLTNARV